jgi:hypothetical protein
MSPSPPRRHGPHTSHPPSCFGCKVLTVQMSPVPFQAHYSYTVGRYVTNKQDFNDALKRLGDIQSERTGISSTYEPVHPADLRASPPPEVAPSHLPRLSDATLPVPAAREAARARAARDAETSNLLDDGES